MGQDENGIRQTPFDKAWPTPDVGGTGLNGIGGGLDAGSGANGIQQSPFDKATPAPGTDCTPVSDFGGAPPYFVDLDGGPGAGATEALDISNARNTVDKK